MASGGVRVARTKEAKPKFRVGQKVWSRQHDRSVTIRKIVMDRDYKIPGYYFKGLPMYWLEYNLRPLTKRERGAVKG
jgi:hypothetical protein